MYFGEHYCLEHLGGYFESDRLLRWHNHAHQRNKAMENGCRISLLRITQNAMASLPGNEREIKSSRFY